MVLLILVHRFGFSHGKESDSDSNVVVPDQIQ